MTDIVFEDLNADHDVGSFDCKKPDFVTFLQNNARRNDKKGLGHTVVAVRSSDRAVKGYYTLCGSVLLRENLPEAELGLPRYPSIPGVLLAKLAVHKDYGGHKLGSRLVMSAMADAVEASKKVGWRFFMIDAYDDDALAFYDHLKLGLMPVPKIERRLYLPIETIRAVLGA